MMNRLILLVFSVHGLCDSTIFADDDLLRLDTISFVKRPISEKQPSETVLRSIEIGARPNLALHEIATAGPVRPDLNCTSCYRPVEPVLSSFSF